MRRSRLAGTLLLTALVGLGLAEPRSQDPSKNTPGEKTGRIQGKVVVSLPGVRMDRLGPIVIQLEPVEGRRKYEVPQDVPTLRQKDARFVPPLLVIAAGQSVDMPNEDRILHNVFSFSRPRRFDLGLYAGGETRRIHFPDAGIVRVYCSIHASMNATIYVAPSPYTAIVDGRGKFSIGDAPPGRYRLTSWCQKLPALNRVVDIRAGETTGVELFFGDKQ